MWREGQCEGTVWTVEKESVFGVTVVRTNSETKNRLKTKKLERTINRLILATL